MIVLDRYVVCCGERDCVGIDIALSKSGKKGHDRDSFDQRRTHETGSH